MVSVGDRNLQTQLVFSSQNIRVDFIPLPTLQDLLRTYARFVRSLEGCSRSFQYYVYAHETGRMYGFAAIFE